MEKIIAKVNALLGKLYIPCGVPADKQMHAIGGFLIALVLTPFIGWYSVVLVAMIATAKELYDYLHPESHTADFWDWVATTLGGLVGFVVVSLLG